MFSRTLIYLAVSLGLICTGCAESGSITHENQKAYEAGQQYRQQYIAAKRPVFRLKFRHQYPRMSEEEIEVLVNDAVEEGLRQEA